MELPILATPMSSCRVKTKLHVELGNLLNLQYCQLRMNRLSGLVPHESFMRMPHATQLHFITSILFCLALLGTLPLFALSHSSSLSRSWKLSPFLLSRHLCHRCLLKIPLDLRKFGARLDCKKRCAKSFSFSLFYCPRPIWKYSSYLFAVDEIKRNVKRRPI